MNPFAGLIAPPQDRPCVDRRAIRKPRTASVPQCPPRRDMPVIANPWKLTPMQYAVMNVLAQGLGKKAAGDKLGIHPKTVDSHLERILQKMDAATKRMALELWDRWTREQP